MWVWVQFALVDDQKQTEGSHAHKIMSSSAQTLKYLPAIWMLGPSHISRPRCRNNTARWLFALGLRLSSRRVSFETKVGTLKKNSSCSPNSMVQSLGAFVCICCYYLRHLPRDFSVRTVTFIQALIRLFSGSLNNKDVSKTIDETDICWARKFNSCLVSWTFVRAAGQLKAFPGKPIRPAPIKRSKT